MNIYISKRGVVRIITFTIAFIICISAGYFVSHNKKKSAEREVEHIYLKAIEEFSTNLDNINNTLNKAQYCGTTHQLSFLSSELWRDCAIAKQALATLPIEEVELTNIYRFLSQVGNYAISISEKATDGEVLTLDEYNTISSLYDYSSKLSSEVWSMDNRIHAGIIDFQKTKDNMKTPDSNQLPSLSEGLEQFESTTPSFPKLIYDGPFSDHILKQEPKMLVKIKEVSIDKAKNIASEFIKQEEQSLNQISDEHGKMSSYRFQTSKGIISVTKNGGYISYMLTARPVYEAKININDALSTATAFMYSNGYTNMITTYYETLNNICTINFANYQDDVVVYTDLIKVSVALDTGEIVGFDARGYLVNHSSREFPNDIITTKIAQKSVSPMLIVNSSRLAYIPNSSGGEVLTYEFSCTAENGQTILVYVNAKNGNEEQILIVYNQGNSVLTM